MSSDDIDFIKGWVEPNVEKETEGLSLQFSYPHIESDKQVDSILTTDNKTPSELRNTKTVVDDGLYKPGNPFTHDVVKPYYMKMLDYEVKPKFTGKLLEIAVRDVVIHFAPNQSSSNIQITSVSILYKKRVICKNNAPFNRKLYKLLIRDLECDNLLIQVHSRNTQSCVLPLPLPKRCVKDKKLEIDFSIGDTYGRIYAGTVICTVTLTMYDSSENVTSNTYLYGLSNDPNDPSNSLSSFRPKRTLVQENVTYFLLEDPALSLQTDDAPPISRKSKQTEIKPPDIVVTEEATFSLWDVSFKNLFQARRPLRPSSSMRRHHTIGKAILTVTVLRGVEVPIREESASVQPIVEVEWGNITHVTPVSEGPAPIWQQTMHFELPRQNNDHYVKLRLYDQHPAWGQQWLGEARIPLEYHRNYQELERWIALSPIYSPVLLFGYVQASPGYSHTRIYILMKMEQPGNAKAVEDSTIETLSKGIQRCFAVPYKVSGISTEDEVGRLAMLLTSLPPQYGPLVPRQALHLNKVDHYGRAALLAVLLQGFGLQAYVLLGSSQSSKWSSFVLSISDNGDIVLWDPEIDQHYNLTDSRCSLMRVARLINHIGIWENMQKSMLPHNLKYDVRVSKDWRLLSSTMSASANRMVQNLDLNSPLCKMRRHNLVREMEEHLKTKLSHWRSTLGLTTMFNQHAVSVLRDFLSKVADSKPYLDKKGLKQLYRAYHTHGFILNLRESTLDELAEQLASTKLHNVTGPIEFGLACYIQCYVGKIYSIWLAVVILRSRA